MTNLEPQRFPFVLDQPLTCCVGATSDVDFLRQFQDVFAAEFGLNNISSYLNLYKIFISHLYVRFNVWK